ncbi:hypothetical protein BsWGS_16848 [Bradybaena similaris]
MAFNNMTVLAALEEFDELCQMLVLSSILERGLRPATSSSGKQQLNLLLLGKTGHGKSATGNSTLGRKEFRNCSSTSSVTSEVKCSQRMCGNYVVNVIDTPGLADTNFSKDSVMEIEQHIENMKKAIRMSPGGIHAFLFVVSFGSRFTEEERRCLHILKQIFGDDFMEDNGIIVFTHGDNFQQSMEDEETPNITFDTWCRKQGGAMGDLITECNNRCLLFNNREKDGGTVQAQMEKLIGLVERFASPYTLIDFILHESLRDKLIVEMKLPKMKEAFQKEIDVLKLDINRRCRLGNVSLETFILMAIQTDELRCKILKEDRGTQVLSSIANQLTAIRLQLVYDFERQEEARRRREKEDKCCIL